jgi:addiction module RelE/StbE family toxin
MTLSIKKTNRFTKDIKKFDPDLQEEAYRIALKLVNDPFDDSLKIKKLKGFEKSYRVVVYKDYRMIYKIVEDSLILMRFAHRKDIYKKL